MFKSDMLAFRSKTIGTLLCIAAALLSGQGHAQRPNEPEVARSSAIYAKTPSAPGKACVGSVFKGTRGKVLCTRQYALDQLLQISALADQSLLYSPSHRADQADLIHDTESLATAHGYLAQQRARVQVLATYASPYVRYLQISPMGVETEAESNASRYWQNTINELQSHTQFKNPRGAVAQLEDLFLLRVRGLSASNCASRFGEGTPEGEFGNDLFSNLRHALWSRSRAICLDRSTAIAQASLRNLFTRFNQELSGRYPFAGLDQLDADADTARRFLVDYRSQRDTLLTHAKLLPKEQRRAADRFFEQLDAVHRYWGSALGVDGAPQGLTVRIAFRALTAYAPHDDQVMQWAISTADQDIQYPAADQTTLKWTPGHSIGVRLVLSERSPWTSMPDPSQRDFIADGKSVAFVHSSPWALARLIHSHRPRDLPASMPRLQPRYWLELKFPLEDDRKRQTTARVYVALMPEMPLPPDVSVVAPQAF